MNVSHTPFLNPEFIIEEIDGESLVYNRGTSQAIYINDTALLIVSMCNGAASIAEMIEILETQYPAEKDRIRTDVINAIEHLSEKRIVILHE